MSRTTHLWRSFLSQERAICGGPGTGVGGWSRFDDAGRFTTPDPSRIPNSPYFWGFNYLWDHPGIGLGMDRFFSIRRPFQFF